MQTLIIKPCGKDRFDRPIFVDAECNAYVDLDPRCPGTCIATKYPKKEAYYGEPDYKLTGRDDGRPDLVKIQILPA